MAARARILALTEDSGRQGQPTLQKVLKEALKIVVDGADLNPARIKIEPLPENDRALFGMRANNWKQDPPSVDTIRLLEAIAGQLAQPTGFVVFHFDTDRVWSERASSEHRQKFDNLVRNKVRRFLRGEGTAPAAPHPRRVLTSEQAEDALQRLLVLSPCYSMESWLYQATTELLLHCRKEHDSKEHKQIIEEWSTDRTRLDEFYRPKHEALPSCVGDRYNEELAKSFPAVEVWLAERSFYESVERLRACTALVEAIGHQVPVSSE
ncbi:MAG: hypothetical protein EOO70_01670 [Myxococcaceae bacterium]|nr:MAG: hypothetical protein EOO70_01670 [Myxococcaceae bacterium]